MNETNPTHSLISNVLYLSKMQWHYSKLSLLFLLLLIPLSILSQFCSIYLPKLAVSEVLNKSSLSHIILYVGSLGLVIVSLNAISKVITECNYRLMLKFRYGMYDKKVTKSFHTDYQNLESPAFRRLMGRSDESLWGSGSGSAVERMTRGSTELITAVLGYVIFGSVLTIINPWIALILTIFALINFYCLHWVQKFRYTNRDEISKLDNKLSYISESSSTFHGAADIRIYGMNEWFVKLFRLFTVERLHWERKTIMRTIIVNSVEAILILLRDGFAYAVLINMVLNHNLSIDDFVLGFAAVGSFSTIIGNIINKFSEINEISLITCDLREFLEYPEKENRDNGIKISNLTNGCKIKISDLHYRYDGAETDTLNGISLEIEKGEKIAIVGLNGSGKTTLIKIICGLYNPTGGTVTMNDHEKKEYNIYDYYSLFSTVFQDFHFLPVSLACTVSGKIDEKTDRKRVKDCLELAGLWKRVERLEHGIDSLLNKQLHEKGVEFSGGEQQKLLLARALYKGAPVLVLDEPTSALDPIAESNMYSTYNDLCKNKTSIFISHRMASTRFCDRILFMENGRIIEEGSHDDLLNKNGKYAELFHVQAKYYKGVMET